MATDPFTFFFPEEPKFQIHFSIQANPLADSHLNLHGNPSPNIKSASPLLPSHYPQFFGQPCQDITSHHLSEDPLMIIKQSSMADSCDSFFDTQDRSHEEQPSSPSSFQSPSEDDIYDPKYDDLIKDFLISGVDKNSKIIQKKPVESKPKQVCPSTPSKAKKRNTWNAKEDALVIELIKEHGQRWNIISKLMDNRSGKQIRDRYLNVLMPDINKSSWTDAEDQIIICLYEEHGPKWRHIAQGLQGRTEAQVKNRFHTHLKGRYAKRLGTGKNASPSPRSAAKQESLWVEEEQSPKTVSTCSESSESVEKRGELADKMFSFI